MKKVEFIVRPATKKDKDALVDFRYKLDVQEWSKISHPKEPKKKTEEYVLRCLKARDYFFFIAEVDGKPVGFSAASIEPNGRTKKLQGVFEAIWVEPNYRKQGIARALSEIRLKKLRQFKPEKISVYIRPENKASIKNIEGLSGKHTYNVYNDI
jgi:ribosomal protein S18 acetylase RimI-like enzyme